MDFKGYRADCINDMALEFLDGYTGEKPFFMTISQIEPHHQNDRRHYEGWSMAGGFSSSPSLARCHLPM